MRWLLLFLLTTLNAQELARTTEAGVTVVLSLETQGNSATLAASFTPELNLLEPYHLYSLNLPPKGLGGAGRPTRLDLPAQSPLIAVGPLTSDQPEEILALGGVNYPVYPPGPVTLRLPIRIPQGTTDASVLLTWQACNSSCLRPVERRALKFSLSATAPSSQPVVQSSNPKPVVEATLLANVVPARNPVRQARGPAGLIWYLPSDLPQVRRILDEAKNAGKSAFLDFTGPSCANCQAVAKSIFPRDDIKTAFTALVLVEMDTDRHQDLAHWQQDAFGTQARPFYVRVDPSGAFAVWGEPLLGRGPEMQQQFIAFLAGGQGRDLVQESGWGWLFLAAILGGLFTLVMPCTYPMIPLTLNVFTKQASAGRRLWPLALAYGAGIVLSFVGIGVIVAGLMGGLPASVAGHWGTNLLIGFVFIVLGLSLLDVFFLHLPGNIEGKLAGFRAGYFGAFAMGLLFAVAAFTCTAPFAGAVLAHASTTGTWYAAIVGLTVYALVLAIPFVLLGLMPGLIKSLPGAGGWMHEVKVVGGLIELAAALKFLAITDAVLDLGLIRRLPVLSLWSALSLLAAIYILGFLRFEADEKLEHIGPLRLLFGATFLTLAIVFFAGTTGVHLGGILEGFFPADLAP